MRLDGAKAAVFLGRHLLVIRRDDRPDVPYPGRLDFPGGGAEHGESPRACLSREIMEEVGLRLRPDQIAPGWMERRGSNLVWFTVVRLPASAVGRVRFGSEGQGWQLMSPAGYLRRRDAIPVLQRRLREWIAGGGKAPR